MKLYTVQSLWEMLLLSFLKNEQRIAVLQYINTLRFSKKKSKKSIRNNENAKHLS